MVQQDVVKTPSWHATGADETLQSLGGDQTKGLAPEEATRRLAEYGPNRLPEGKKRGPFMRFLLQFNNILVYVLLAAGFVKLMLGLWLDASIILGVVIINALARVHSGGQGREGAGLDPQHAFGGGADRCAAARRA